MTDRRRMILERVASGELAPEEAVALLAQTDPPRSTAGPKRTAVGRVVVEADLGAVAIVADDTVDDVVAVGAHELRRIDGEVRVAGAHDRSILSDGRLLPRRGRHHALRVRMRPDLPLSVKLGAGTVHVDGLTARIDIEVDLGTATIEHVGGAFEVRVSSGSASVSGLITEGASRISCDLGSISVRLDANSSVTVTAATEAGRITLPGARSKQPSIVFGTKSEATLGNGDGQLDLRAAAGSISVKVDR